jgi:hypothetical protein
MPLSVSDSASRDLFDGEGYKGGSFGYIWIGSSIFAPFVVSSWNLRFNEVPFGALCSEVP